MNVSIETMTGLERRLTITIDGDQFEDQIAARLNDARGKVKIPGFRAGKVPLKEVRRRYGSAIRAEVAGELMQSSFVEAVQQESLTPAGSPKLDVIKMDPGIDFEFTATFEVFPSVELANFDKIAVKRPSAEITAADLDDMIVKLREQNATQEIVERASADGDQITVDFEGMLDGERVESACGEGMAFTIGKGQMIADFDKGVVGLSAGEESTFDAVFPDDYQAEDMQGKTVQFSVKVIDVKETQLPEMNEEFFKKFGIDETTEEAFLSEVKANMTRELDNAIKNQVKQQAMDGLSEIHDFSLPHDVVHREIHVLKDQMMSQFQMPPGQAQQLDLPDALFQDQAEKRVKVGLVVNEIMTSKAMVADPEKIDARLQEIAAPYGEPEQVIEWYRSNPEQMNNIEMAVLEDQVVDLIMEQASIEEVVSNYTDVISGAAIAAPEEASEEASEEATS
ncbi:trigger factor [Pseudomonadales bacterium]|jgi:trigger factor|nr:trigger factor [Pseudomonadales bacterium]